MVLTKDIMSKIRLNHFQLLSVSWGREYRLKEFTVSLVGRPEGMSMKVEGGIRSKE